MFEKRCRSACYLNFSVLIPRINYKPFIQHRYSEIVECMVDETDRCEVGSFEDMLNNQRQQL